MRNENLKVIHDVVKEYPDMIQIYIYHQPYALSKKRSPEARQLSKEAKAEASIQRSVRRSRTTVKDIIMSNKFDYWCTFTFDKTKVDRYDMDKCRTKMSNWLHRQHAHSPKLKYVIVPELHQDGALHFHALLANFNGRLKDSGRKTKSGQSILNATGYRSGFTEFVKIDGNNEALSRYMTKAYITKQMPLFSGRKRFWTSRNLTRPVNHVNGVMKYGLSQVIKNYKPLYTTQSFEVQQHKIHKKMTLTSFGDTLIEMPEPLHTPTKQFNASH